MVGCGKRGGGGGGGGVEGMEGGGEYASARPVSGGGWRPNHREESVDSVLKSMNSS